MKNNNPVARKNNSNNSIKAPQRSLGSNFSLVTQSMLVEREHEKHWSTMRRIPRDLRIRREIAKFKEDISLATGRGVIEGFKKSFVVFKKISGKFVPIGLGAKNRRFSKWSSAKEYVRALGRTHAKCGPIVSDVTV